MSRMTREMFCLMEGRHVHPSTLYPGGVGTVPTVQLFTDYLVRLMKYVEFMKKVVPLHDDLFDFFYEALPGYEEVGQTQSASRLLGIVQQSRRVRLHLQEHDRVGPRHVRHAGRGGRRQAGHHRPGRHQPEHPHSAGQFVLRRLGELRDVREDRIRWAIRSTSVIPGTRRRSRVRRSAISAASTPGSCRRAGSTSAPATISHSTPAVVRSRASGPPRWPAWSTSATSRRPATASRCTCPRPLPCPRSNSNGRFRSGAMPSNAIAREPTSRSMPPAAALHFVEQALEELHAGRTKTWTDFKVPEEAIGCGFHEAVRGVLSHHVVIRNGKIANYHPYPPTPWNANPRDVYGTPGPYEDAVQNTPIFEENGPDKFKGIDIMRAVRSFDPCLPCGVHMYLGDGKVLETRHSPMFGLQP